MPEVFPSAPQGSLAAGTEPNIDRCWTCRSMVMQAWGNYGTAWPVIHQQLGVRPFLNDGELDVVPQVPSGQGRVAGRHIRLGSGWVDVAAADAGNLYTADVDAIATPVQVLRIGITLPRGSRPLVVRLDGRVVHRYAVLDTNRGVEVTVGAPSHRRHVVSVLAA